jgi:3-oxoacyl-[acyl-carrier protein] reductase
MQFDFRDWKVIITGGSRGIGRARALAFAGYGARVSICARGGEALEATRTEIEDHLPQAHSAILDWQMQRPSRSYVKAAADALGGIDVLLNNATGFDNPRGHLGKLPCG